MSSPRPTGATWTPGYLPRRTIATLLAAIAPAATAVSAPAASLLPVSEDQDRGARVTCVANAWDAPLTLEAAAIRVSAERPPPPAWPPPAPVWQPAGTSPTPAGVPISPNPASTSVVHWLGVKERLLAAHASQLEFLVTRSYQHVQLDHAGRVVSSRRGDLDSVVTVDIRPFSAQCRRSCGRPNRGRTC